MKQDVEHIAVWYDGAAITRPQRLPHPKRLALLTAPANVKARRTLFGPLQAMLALLD